MTQNKSTRIIISLLTLWSFVNLVILLLGFTQKNKERECLVKVFYPLKEEECAYYFDEKVPNFSDILLKYDISEFVVYAITPWLLFVLYKYITKK
jgi:hypothetical protein